METKKLNLKQWELRQVKYITCFLALLATSLPLTQPIKAQPTRVGDIVYGAFTKSTNGTLSATYSVVRSDIVGYGVSFDCVSLKVNIYAPDGMPGTPGVKWRWTGWEDGYSSEHLRMLGKQCKKFYE